MPNTKPLFRNSHVLATILLWVASSFVLSAEIGPPKATDSELAKASYSEEKKLKDLPSAFIDTSPNAEDGLAVGTLGIDGGKGDSILQFANEHHGQLPARKPAIFGPPLPSLLVEALLPLPSLFYQAIGDHDLCRAV